jgi:hypothetical protein
MMSPQTWILFELSLLAMACMFIGMSAGAWIRSYKAKRELAVYSGELRRTQSRLRSADRPKLASGRSGYGALSRKHNRASDDIRAAMSAYIDDNRDKSSSGAKRGAR